MRTLALTSFDRLLIRIHRKLFVDLPIPTFAVSYLIYALTILFFGNSLHVSGNYLILIPLISAAMAWGIPGGLVFGALGLPSNLLLFAIIQHPEFSPESKAIAELSGLLVGSAMGYMSEYFRKMEAYALQRKNIEEDLRKALREKEILLKEVHHRVKNNLAVIKSLIQLQASRSDVPGFKESSEQLKGRIYSISLIHDLLYVSDDISAISTDSYVETLVRHVMSSQDKSNKVELRMQVAKTALSLEFAVPLGLIINEIMTNALRHAFGPSNPAPRINLELEINRGIMELRLEDNGKGVDDAQGNKTDDEKGLGLKLIPVLVSQLQGEYTLQSDLDSGTIFELRFPYTEETEAPAAKEIDEISTD